MSLHTHQMVSNLEFLGKEFKYITWFPIFEIIKFDDERWIITFTCHCTQVVFSKNCFPFS